MIQTTFEMSSKNVFRFFLDLASLSMQSGKLCWARDVLEFSMNFGETHNEWRHNQGQLHHMLRTQSKQHVVWAVLLLKRNGENGKQVSYPAS